MQIRRNGISQITYEFDDELYGWYVSVVSINFHKINISIN